ncbi:MAG TPA: potassium channel family protein [Bryobacteraceae bacterium]
MEQGWANDVVLSRHIGDGIMLIAATVVIHSAGTLLIVWTVFRFRQLIERHFGFVHNTAIIMGVVLALLGVHLAEIGAWAAFFSYKQCFSNFDTSLYFSIVTYTTLGYGDVLLNEEWRLLGGVEALIGSLMMTWSTAVILGVITRIYSRRKELWSGERDLS